MHRLCVKFERVPFCIAGTNLEDFKASDIQDPDEGGSLSLSAVQSSVDPVNQPPEQALVCGLGQRLDGKVSLQERTHTSHIIKTVCRHTHTQLML